MPCRGFHPARLLRVTSASSHFHFHRPHYAFSAALSHRPATSLKPYPVIRYVSTMEDPTEAWTATGARTIRARSETNRITTLTRESLEEAAVEDGEDMAIYAREGEVRLYRWEDPIPEDLFARKSWRPCGVREIHTSGTSTVITLTERALSRAGFSEGTKLQQHARKGGLKLSTDGPDVEVTA